MSVDCSKSGRARTTGRLVAGGLALAAVAGACGSSSHQLLPKPTTTSTTTATTTVPASTTSTTLAELAASGPRTVLSPVGLNVRATPSKSAKILGTAAEGVVLTVLSHSALGWFQVKGTTVTGWISDNSTLSAPGRFKEYSSSANLFGALYPTTWTVSASPPSVVFKEGTTPDTIVVTPEATVALLPKVRAGYHQTNTEQVVVCGVTSQLVTFAGTVPAATATTTAAHVVAPRPYLAQINLTLDAKHALGINANITSLPQLQTVRNFANSVTFPLAKCVA